MKHIIIEGGDALGKNTLIKEIINYFNYDNIIVRHFAKPPKILPIDISSSDFQAKCFYKESILSKQLLNMEQDPYLYYENILIWNRSHLGEYVYSIMFRNRNKDEVETYIKNYESLNIDIDKTYLILLTADPIFFLNHEDGNSFSQNIDQKTQELKLFDEIFEKSIIINKLKLKVNNGTEYLDKQYLFNKVKDFLKI